MAISSLDKNSIGICLSLLLVIILSESRLFNFFTDTYLGRAFLIIIILFASYLHKILGVVCVLIIIIMFNNNDFSSYYEGFGSNEKDGDDKKNDGKDAQPINTSKPVATANTPTTSSGSISKPINTPTPVPDDKTTNNSTDKSIDASVDKINVVTSSSAVNKSIEGFDLQSTENNIKRGKQSNSIPVDQYNKQSIEVAPYESASFSNFFGLL
jgi:hypothetical protein